MAKPSSNQNGHSRPENRSLKSKQFKGIRMRKWGKWVSQIRMPNSKGRIWLGSYDTPEKAARAYDFAVYCLRGSKAKFNFPYSPPEFPYASSLSPLQIQAAAANFAAEEFQLPSEDNAEFSSSCSNAESSIECQEISGPAFGGSVLEDPEIPYASSISPPQIQAAAAKFAPEEFQTPSEDNAAFSSSCSKAESGIEGQEISGPAFWDSVLEDLDSCDSITLEDFPPIDMTVEDYGFLFQLNKECGPGKF